MSQNKTRFPGIGQDGDFTPNNGYSHQPYNRPNSGHKGTVIPGMGGYSAGVQQQQAPQQPQKAQRQETGGKPIVGFLYSISRSAAGEYWPLHIGQNVIGNNNDCEICLGEGTVSARHASLHINKMKKPEKTEATISDLGSTNGTLVNDNSVSVARPIECINGDIITIGENYQLLLILIDTKAIGLEVSQEFYDTRSQEPSNEYDNEYEDEYSGNSRGTVNIQDFPPKFTGPMGGGSPYDGSHRPTDGTVGMGPEGGFQSGGTIGM